jgi:uncharacterized protein (DUF885 family)
MTTYPGPLGAALRIVDDTWCELSRSPYLQAKLGRTPARLPEISLAEASRRSRVGRVLLEQIAGAQQGELPHDLRLMLQLAAHYARAWAREADWYWLVHDPLGTGTAGLFSATAYCGGFLVATLRGIVQAAPFEHAGDLDRYLALMADYPRLLDQMRERANGQTQRGILMPKVQVVQARTLLCALRADAGPMWRVAAARLPTGEHGGFHREVERRIAQHIEPAFDALLAVYDDAYLANAPERVGMGQYPGGAQVFAELAKHHTTLDLSPEQIHAAGLERMARIGQQMRAVRAEQGYANDPAAYHAKLDADPAWRAHSPQAVIDKFQRYIDRFTPHYARCFGWSLGSPPAAAALPGALETSMSFGYYNAPCAPGAPGVYFFNGRNLTRKGLATLAALNYHELVPGHHQHMVTQNENAALHPLQAHSFVNAYNEGWAEYAATLAGELGCYAEHQERYGRLMMDAFLTSRLVVDTGMNAFGWSLEQAREYMRANAHLSESEIETESIRYSCDIPAQSLAYKLGDTYLLELRKRMQARLGAQFDLRDFHHAVLHPGALPLPALALHLDHVCAGRLASGTAAADAGDAAAIAAQTA